VARQGGNDALIVSVGADRVGITGGCLPALGQFAVQGEFDTFGGGALFGLVGVAARVSIQIARLSCSILNSATLEFSLPSKWLPLMPTS
jgi:hypothetical protein